MKITKKISLAIITLSLIFSCHGLVLAQGTMLPQVYFPQETSKEGSKIELVNRLTKAPWQLLVADAIKLLLGITGALTMIAFTVGGVMMVTNHGNEDQVTKAKQILIWSVVALVIIAASFAIVTGITQFVYFS